MKKEKQQIATNTSSGAEKVEKIEREVGKTAVVEKTTKKEISAKGEAALGSEKKVKEEKVSAKKINAQSSGSKAEKESAAAKARVAAALKKKEEKEKRKTEKAARAQKRKEERKKYIAELKAKIEKRKAEKKARAEKHAAERKALAEKRAAEKEAKIRERAHNKANRNRKKAEKEKRRPQRKNHDEKKENRTKGYGGWIAAVVSLGVVTLALATTVTVGAIEMNKAMDASLAAYRGTMYELTGIMEHVDDDLDRVRISASSAQQSRILTDLLVQVRLAEADLEKLPVSAESDRNVTQFINHTAMECERMLGKLRMGGELNDKDYEILNKLYNTNHTIREELDKLTAEMSDKDFMHYMKKGEGTMKDALERLENATLEENRAAMEGMTQNAPAMPPEKSGAHIDSARAEELCRAYFSAYKISEYQCVGETVSQTYTAYNVQGYDDKGTLLFAEISQKDGALLRFDYYEDCMGDNFDLKNAERIAEQFLEDLGYDDMEIVRLRENGTTTDFTFVYEDDDVLYYPDEVHVKVCRTRGLVTGMDASKYLQNHKERKEPEVKISLAEAYGKLHKALSVEASRLAVVRTGRGERPAYEFFCSYGNENYFVYLDAVNGEEISIINAQAVQ